MADDAGLDEVIGTLTTVMALNYNNYLSGMQTVSNAVTNFYKITTSARDKDLALQIANTEKVRKNLIEAFTAGKISFADYSSQLKPLDNVLMKLRTVAAQNEVDASSFAVVGLAGAAAAVAIAYAWAKAAPIISDTVQRAERIQTTAAYLEAWNGASVLAGQGTEAFATSIEGLHKNLMSLHNLMPIQSMQEMVSGINLPLTAIGLNRSQLAGLGSTEQLKLIANGLSQVTDKTLQQSIAQELFGDSGYYMLKYLKDGAVGVDVLQRKMTEFNVVLTEGQSNAIQDTVMTWREFKLALQGVYEQLSASVAPALTAVLNILIPIVQAISDIFYYLNKINDAFYIPIPEWMGGKPNQPAFGSSTASSGPPQYNPQLSAILGVGKQSLATQQEFVKNLVKAAPPHMAYAW